VRRAACRIKRTARRLPISDAKVSAGTDEIIAELLDTKDWERGGDCQVPFVIYLIVGCSGAG
jgi:hypothetical protein